MGIEWLVAAAIASMLGTHRKNEKFKKVQQDQNRWRDQERANRTANYKSSSEALNEALTKFDKDSSSFRRPNVSYAPKNFELPANGLSTESTNPIISSADEVVNYDVKHFGDALAEMDNVNNLVASLAPELMKAETTGNYASQRMRAGQNTLENQLRGLKGQEYDMMGDLLSQLGGAGMTYGLNKYIG